VTITPAKRNQAKKALPTGQEKKRAQKPICTANAARSVRHRDVSNEYPLVIQKILRHLNKKMTKSSKIFFRKVEHLLRQVYFNKNKFIINKSNIQSWFAQQRLHFLPNLLSIQNKTGYILICRGVIN
jgi:Fe-S oxidoreductase